jgi:hypothetical protein
MATERLVLCGGADGAKYPSANPIHLDIYGPRENVHLHLWEVRKALWTDIPKVLRDLLDLAAYVTAADQAVDRADGGRVSGDELGAGWRRAFRFRIPVREPDLWNSDPVQNVLVPLLSFLSEDEYAFEFVPIPKDPPLDSFIEFDEARFEGEIEEAIAFSGGLDSLAGAVTEAVARRRQVLLVNQRSTNKLVPQHERLVQALRDRAGERAPVHFAVRANRTKAVGGEYTQRTRSFLVAALGVMFARMIGLNRFRFYENGVVSLNLPPSPQVVGSRASRTTHPRVLAGFERLFSALLGRSFVVENPFLWDTKTDVVKRIADAGCGELIGLSRSCGQTIALESSRHTHCGVCSQCLDRRFAVLAAGQEAHDPASNYAVDLLVGDRGDGDPKTMLAGYLELAGRVSEMGESDFLTNFGELARALPHLNVPLGVASARTFDLYRRHAQQVTGVVNAALMANMPALRRRRLPPSCLLRIAYDDGTTASDAASTSGAANSFVRRGACWSVRYDGRDPITLLPSLGAAYLRILLSQPHTPVSAPRLACLVAGCPAEYALGNAGEALDEDACSAYRARCAELREDIRRARRDNDEGAESRAETELTQITTELRRATGLGGRIRVEADDAERARKAVGNAIRRALRDIKKYDPLLAEHLREPRLTCGRCPCYRPDRERNWEV